MYTVFVANRAEIAERVIRTARALGWRTAAASSAADRELPYTRAADVVVEWDGPSDATATWLDADRVLAAAIQAGADAIHPGYGFLSENAAFAEKVQAAGLVWIGPPPSAIRAMGDKGRARKVAVDNGVDVVPGYDASQDADALLAAARELGFPVLIKAVAGGGGRGMRLVEAGDDFAAALASARREAEAAFGDGDVILERYVTRPRHVEIQVMADRHGTVLWLGERECSIQRRHQKVVEEAPSPGISAETRRRMGEAAVRVVRAVGYVGAGTVEFIVPGDDPDVFWFLETNTRLQVEHPVTELVTGLDLVELQLRVAAGERLPLVQEDVRVVGHAIEVRVYAEDPMRGFLPATGPLHRFDVPDGPGIRIDAGYTSGNVVSPNYDAMLAKVIGFGPDRATATRRLRRTIDRTWIPGLVTNLPLLRQILAHPMWAAADLDTRFLDRAGLPEAPPLNLHRGALAATALGIVERRGTLPGPAAWRLHGRAAQTDRYRCGEALATVRWTATDSGFRASITSDETTEHEVRVHGKSGDLLDLSVDGLRAVWRVLRIGASADHLTLDDGDRVYVHLGDGEAFVELVPRFPARAPDAGEPGQLTAPTPGRIAAIHVVVGDAVTGGQRLVTVEAMKMEHAVTAPEDGLVAELYVAVGDNVADGARLVRVEPAP